MIARKYARGILALITMSACIVLWLHGRIPQDPAYHAFADTREIAGIENFGNVLSNLPFLLFGLFGLSRVRRLAEPESRNGYIALCLGVVLVGFGSAYYHHAPSNAALVWDRLPMTIAFMALFSLLLDERAVLGAKIPTLWPLLIAGIASVAYWRWSEIQGNGDLRPYVLVQFLPIVLVPIILWLFPGRYLSARSLLVALAIYVGAKIFELFDRQLLQATGIVSGHTIKHLLAAVAVLCIILAIPVARPSAKA